ncbi:hypothetical protein HK103_004383 [Boothiomyces macroporosus]|uniref:Uncharacterized protein n=1 Tax=Boothiomyces macroporosus TaxID=261099 RepID=A0AAD5Y3F8_9FUNG|nr:hypothetical protein HK103_004383 [Boothiomyces macroporosus]
MGNYQSVEDSVNNNSSIIITKEDKPEIEIAPTQDYSVSYRTELEKAGINAHFERVSPIPQISLPVHSFEEEKHSVQIPSIEIQKNESLKRGRSEVRNSNQESIPDNQELQIGSPPVQSISQATVLQPTNQYSYVNEEIKRSRQDKGVTLPALK